MASVGNGDAVVKSEGSVAASMAGAIAMVAQKYGVPASRSIAQAISYA